MPWYQDRGLWADVTYGGASVATVRIAGEIDMASAQAARAAVEELPDDAKLVILDLRQVSFIDAAGLGFLIAARERATVSGKDLVVRHPSRAVRRLFDLAPNALAGADGSVCPAGPSPDVAAICEDVVARAIHYSGADMGNVQVLDRAGGMLRIAAAQGFEHAFLDFFETVGDDTDSACGAALIEARPTWVPDVATSPIFAGTPALDVMLEAQALAVVSVPVLGSDGSVIAMISAHYRQPTAWTAAKAGQITRLATATGQLLSSASRSVAVA